jgi:hypothetical protein
MWLSWSCDRARCVLLEKLAYQRLPDKPEKYKSTVTVQYNKKDTMEKQHNQVSFDQTCKQIGMEVQFFIITLCKKKLS